MSNESIQSTQHIPRTTINTLPTELHKHVCSFLYERADLKNARLTCAALAAVAEHYMVLRINFEFTAESLRKLVESVRHSKFGKHIVALAFEPRRFTQVDYGRFLQDCFETWFGGIPCPFMPDMQKFLYRVRDSSDLYMDSRH